MQIVNMNLFGLIKDKYWIIIQKLIIVMRENYIISSYKVLIIKRYYFR